MIRRLAYAGALAWLLLVLLLYVHQLIQRVGG